MQGDLQELLRRALEVQSSGSSWQQLLEEFGISLDNEEQVKKLIAQAGFAEQDLAKARSLVDQMLTYLDPGAKEQLAGIVSQLIQGKEERVPPEVKEIIEDLKKQR